MRFILCGLITLYQWTLRPFFGASCRFTPTCSDYGYEAIKCHGCFYGGYLTVWRILRCNPYCTGGKDPVPLKEDKKEK